SLAAVIRVGRGVLLPRGRRHSGPRAGRALSLARLRALLARDLPGRRGAALLHPAPVAQLPLPGLAFPDLGAVSRLAARGVLLLGLVGLFLLLLRLLLARLLGRLLLLLSLLALGNGDLVARRALRDVGAGEVAGVGGLQPVFDHRAGLQRDTLPLFIDQGGQF